MVVVVSKKILENFNVNFKWVGSSTVIEVEIILLCLFCLLIALIKHVKLCIREETMYMYEPLKTDGW